MHGTESGEFPSIKAVYFIPVFNINSEINL